MNRGSDDLATGRASLSHCFNEAPIHESGKSRIVSHEAYESQSLQ